MKKLLNFFDKLEDHIRRGLSPYPIVYALIAGTGTVLFWRGVWEVADLADLSGAASLIISILMLLACGAFVSTFIGNNIIISGLKGEKKAEEKTLEEITEEGSIRRQILDKLDRLEKEIAQLSRTK